MKSKKSMRNKRIILSIVAVLMIFAVGKEIYTTISTKYAISVAKNENEQLKKESEELQNQVAKLKDENYIQSYVSGTIFSTESGTSIYVLPEDDKTPE